jgi:hypothetical protein
MFDSVLQHIPAHILERIPAPIIQHLASIHLPISMLTLILEIIAALSLAFFGYVAVVFGNNYVHALTSPLANLPGPKRDSLLSGNFRDAPEANSLRLLESWLDTYGRAVRYYTVFGVRVVLASVEADADFQRRIRNCSQ